MSNVKRFLLKDFDEFARKLRCKFLFDTGENSKLHPFKTSTGYKPDPVCGALENYIDKTKLEISSLPIKQFQDNLTSQERAALTSLKNNRHIVIKKADKSNTVVIMDREKYISEALRQLKSKHYIEVDKPDLSRLHNIKKKYGICILEEHWTKKHIVI